MTNVDKPSHRLSRILTETYATLPSRGGACNRRATRTVDGCVNVLTVSVLSPKQVWRVASKRNWSPTPGKQFRRSFRIPFTRSRYTRNSRLRILNLSVEMSCAASE